MSNPSKWPAMTAMARVLTLKEMTGDFAYADDLTTVSIHENDERLMQRFAELVHPKHRAAAMRAAAFISGIVQDEEGRKAAYERLQKVMDIEAAIVHGTPQNLPRW
jgi:hypothetical protein